MILFFTNDRNKFFCSFFATSKLVSAVSNRKVSNRKVLKPEIASYKATLRPSVPVPNTSVLLISFNFNSFIISFYFDRWFVKRGNGIFIYHL
ncbi:MAG: hypothetical protein ACJAS9_002502 [Polaribacter sp.]|jgi:hypothetical protein